MDSKSEGQKAPPPQPDEAPQPNGFRGTDGPRPSPGDEHTAEDLAKKVLDEARRHENILQHCRYEVQPDGSVLYLLRDQPAFVDHGNQLLMRPGAQTNEEAVMAALLVAKEKFGALELTGSPEFKQFALEVILRNKIDVRLKNPLQDAQLREMRLKSQGASTTAADPRTSAPGDGVTGEGAAPR
ncbi:LPD7 domain-containing protein, partial [Achromobacter insuavis]|uniref:LPD7 domain-containing protein n=1 Tax=Achromobacter insuavis TaxID=1287735 RepID=UPI0030B87BBB